MCAEVNLMRVSIVRDRLTDVQALGRRGAAWWLAGAMALVACGGGGGGNAGGGGGQGGQGGTGGTGGAMMVVPRGCGDGQPCSAGATCSIPKSLDWTFKCACDPSGHFECYTGGAAGPPDTCYPDQFCFEPEPPNSPDCTKNNGYCERTCTCTNGTYTNCMHDCQGTGPAADDTVCDLKLCETSQIPVDHSACNFKDGACSYSVMCKADGTASYEGTCAAAP
jgi:hypothetical protein